MRLRAFAYGRRGALAGECLKEVDIVMTAATQRRAPDRLVTLDPFELGAPSREMPEIASPLDVGCVDWYLYPVSRKARPIRGSRSAPRVGAAVPSRGSPAA